ncbi:DNA/RNA non-specific endonuclease [Sutcliffiella cohnii]
MQRIQIKPDVVMNSSKLLPTSSVENIQDDLTRVRARLDHRIRSRHNIDGRLNKVIRDIDDIERKMRKIKNFTQQSMERYTQVERDLANYVSRMERLQKPISVANNNWWERFLSNVQKTKDKIITDVFPWLNTSYKRPHGVLYPIGPVLSFNKWINPSCPRDIGPSDIEKGIRAAIDFLKGIDKREALSTTFDFLPVIGNFKSAGEVYSGVDPITGRELEGWERWIAAAGIVGGGYAKLGGRGFAKVVNKVGDVGKGTGKDITIVKYGDQYTRDGRTKVLKPNVEYTSKEGYNYKTDGHGRINSAEGTLKLGDGKRNNYAQKVVGREYRKPDDEGGHLIANIFKGSGNLDNLVPMNGNLNKGEWKKLENTWSDALKHGDEVKVKITPNYKGNSQRPESFNIKYKIGDDEWEIRRFDNVPGG